MIKEDLVKKTEECGVDLDSSLIPTIALKLGYAKGKPQNGLLVDIMPREDENDKVGLGVFPLFEAIGSSNPNLPEHDDVEEQLCLFLRAVTATNNVNKNRFLNLFDQDNFPASASGVIRYMWPEFRGPLGRAPGAQSRSTPGL